MPCIYHLLIRDRGEGAASGGCSCCCSCCCCCFFRRPSSPSSSQTRSQSPNVRRLPILVVSLTGSSQITTVTTPWKSISPAQNARRRASASCGLCDRVAWIRWGTPNDVLMIAPHSLRHRRRRVLYSCRNADPVGKSSRWIVRKACTVLFVSR